MGSRIFVGGLPYSTSESKLTELFSAHGSVDSVHVVTDNFTGKSRGFAFVEMANKDEAEAAIAALNGTDLEGRTLTVNEARPRESQGTDRRSRPGRSGPGGGRSGPGRPRSRERW